MMPRGDELAPDRDLVTAGIAIERLLRMAKRYECDTILRELDSFVESGNWQSFGPWLRRRLDRLTEEVRAL